MYCEAISNASESGKFKELKVIFDLMSKYPNYIAATDSFDSLFNRIMKGKAVTKIGMNLLEVFP